jgi:hypothetical protein
LRKETHGMVRASLRALQAAFVLGAVLSFLAPPAKAAHPDLFYNFYVGPTANGSGVPAQSYISPLPTPPLVGHTFNTYQPLMPHEFLYHHHRRYFKYYRNGGHTSACVKYYSCPGVAFVADLFR